ncbi:hypothetical protein J4212_03600 [Candidatus Woesearchaeota archaeon]|nr:hypothetical protein [Candidatus Woesearchaeota archaeon]
MEFLPYFLVSAASYFGLVAGSTIMKLAYSEKDELRQILFMIRKGLLFIIFVTAVFFTFGNTPVSLGFALFFAALSFFKYKTDHLAKKSMITYPALAVVFYFSSADAAFFAAESALIFLYGIAAASLNFEMKQKNYFELLKYNAAFIIIANALYLL